MRTSVLLPEVLVAAAGLGLLMVRWLRLFGGRWPALTALLVTVAALALELWLGGQVGTLFQGGWRQDRFALFAKAAMLVALAGLIASSDWDSETAADTTPLAFMVVFGGMVVASATSLVGLWAGLELAAIASVVAGGMTAREAGSKLLAVSVLAGALVTVGFAFLYGITGAATLSGLRQALVSGPLTLSVALISLLTLTGMAVRLGVVPFQGGDATERRVATGPAGASVLQGLAVGVVVLALAKLLAAMFGASAAWGTWLGILAAIGMLVGGLRAIVAATPRALTAWLVVHQLGWVAAGLAVHDGAGSAGALFLLAPLLVAAVAGPLLAGAEDVSWLGAAGLGRREPARAAGLALVLLSLAGVPPLAGFFGEFAVSAELVRSGVTWLLACGLLGALLAAVGAVRGLRAMYLDEGPEEGRRVGLRRAELWSARPLLPALIMVAYGPFANPIQNLAAQGAAALGLR